jgi:putative chitinase
MITEDQLRKLIPQNKNVKDWHLNMVQILPSFEINTNKRIAAFIAQCAHESLDFIALRENLNYRWESLRRVFPKYFPTDELAKQYERKPEMIANRVYANRMGNGPESSGDGWKYAGKGLIQLTGKNNYTMFAKSVGMSLEEVPNYLITFEGAIKSACWFWQTNKLNRFVDADNIDGLSRAINGGTHGLEDRRKRYNNALSVLGT